MTETRSAKPETKPSPGMDAGGNTQGRGNPARRGGMKGLGFGEWLNFDIF